MVKLVTKPGPKHLKSPKKKASAKDRIDRLFLWVLIGFGLLMVLSYLSVFISPKVSPFPMFLGLYFIPLAGLNILLLIIAIIRHNYALFIPLLALLPAIFHSDLFLKVGKGEVPEQSGEAVKVLTYNIGKYMLAGKGMSEEKTISGIRELISDKSPDIVCLQEFLTRDTASLLARLPDYPYRYSHFFHGSTFFGNITLSRYPIVGNEAITFGKSTNLCIKSDVKTDFGIISIFNCHLESYSLSFTSIIKRLTRNGYFREEFISLHDRIGSATVKRTDQVEKILEIDRKNRYPSIICGDFNDTPVSYTYRQLKSGRKDTFSEAGNGFSSTYSVLWPLLRIDYILIPNELGCSEHEVLRAPYSDHYPVISTIFEHNSKN